MNKTRAEGLAFARALREAERGRDPRVQRFVIPPFTALAEVCAALDGTSVRVGAQNGHWADAGAWTGEVSMPQIARLRRDAGRDRPQRAADPFRRDRRDGGPQGRGRAPPRPHAAGLHRRARARTRRRAAPTRCSPAR